MENTQPITTSNTTARFRTQRQTRKKHEDNIVVVDPGIECRHCSERYGHKVTNTYPNGNRRLVCSKCGKPFVTTRKALV